MRMPTPPFSRRDFLSRLAAVGTVGSIAACADAPQRVSEPEADAASFACTDTSGLTDMEIQARSALEYVDTTPIQGKTCDNCAFYVVPADGAQCGTCLTVKGPVHPKGYCNIWAEVPA